MMKMASSPIPSGNAITSDTAFYFTTPVTIPTGNTVTIEGLIVALNYVTTDTPFFDFTANKTYFAKLSSSSRFRYKYYGNDFEIATPADNHIHQNVKKVELKQPSGIFTVTLDNDSTIDSNYERSWPSRTTELRLYLSPYFAVKEITQVNSSNSVIHHLVPDYQNGVVGMVDTVTETFYGDTSGRAYLTTI